ncbi:O-methyltransferase [Virgibacillus pantothenticus]|nr:O-methyltransferase [Virgibacillus pantothenticus]SIT02563.1 Predicted O-methyltransferase YrrM [Virgibacillus pantothenticus]
MMKDNSMDYLVNMIPKRTSSIDLIEQGAKKDRVPIMEPVSMHFVQQIIRLKQPKRILEIGTAIGYSALRMLEAAPDAEIVTMERDVQRYQEAIQNIRTHGAEKQIKILLGDALEMLKNLQNEALFDVIFIDAAKSQYRRFFELVTPLLANEGIIITDNVLFRGYVEKPHIAPSRYKKMVEKINDYNHWLMQHPLFTTSIVPIGDGIAISMKHS